MRLTCVAAELAGVRGASAAKIRDMWAEGLERAWSLLSPGAEGQIRGALHADLPCGGIFEGIAPDSAGGAEAKCIAQPELLGHSQQKIRAERVHPATVVVVA